LGVQPLQQLPLWGYNREEIKIALSKVPFKRSFRTTYEYNNVLYLWVEDLVQNITGMPWGEFITKNLLGPLGMLETKVGRKEADPNRLTAGHIHGENNPGVIQKVEFSEYPDIFLAAGGLVGTLKDLTHWMFAQMECPSPLSGTQTRFLQRPQTVIGNAQFYGLGWRILTNRPHKIITHGGLIKGIKHQLWIIPEIKSAIAVLTNLTNGDTPLAVAEYFADLALGLEERDYIDHFKSLEGVIKKPESPRVITGKPIPTSALGLYTSPILGQGKLIEDKGRLIFELGPKSAQAKLHPLDSGHYLMEFEHAHGGKIGEAFWGELILNDDKIILRAQDRFDSESFEFRKF
jgi:CubicO group peptidase (beta-lactamase class C family)